MNLDDIFVMPNVRTGPKLPTWREVGTHSLEFDCEFTVDEIEVKIHAWLKRHCDHLTIAWSAVACHDNDAAVVGDPLVTTLTVSSEIRGVLRGTDEDALKAEFKRVASKAATSCIGRVAVAWGTGL